MAIKRTYWCAFRGTVHRQDNLTGPWLDKSVPNQNITLNDIKSNPADGDKVYTVGTFNTIYYSANAGNTWTAANAIALNPSTEWHEVWPIDINTIVAVGSLGSFGYSTNGGATWTSPVIGTPFAASGSIRAVHFLTPLIGVVGYENQVYKTIDGGATWTLLNGPGFVHIAFTPTEINGIHISQNQQIIVVHANTGIWTSTDGGTTFIQTYNAYVYSFFPIVIAAGKHLTWFDDNTLWATSIFGTILQTTNGGLTWLMMRGQAPSLLTSATTISKAAHFYTSTDGFYSVQDTLFVSADAGVTGTFADTLGNLDPTINAVWTSSPGPCYNLIACGGKPFPLLVNNDLSLLVGQVVMVDGNCYTVQLAQSCQGSVTITTPITSFLDCCECNPPTCYELRDCTGLTPVIVTNTNLANYIGQTVKVCEFTASPVIQIPGTNIVCTNLNEKGFVTQITGPTSGFYYESSSGLIKPYTNPLLFPLLLSDQICVNPASPFDVVSTQAGTWTIQFFLGTTPLTNPIIISTVMPISTVQFFINQQIIYPDTTITVNTFDTFNFLNVTIIITAPTDETQITIIATSTSGDTLTVVEDLFGGCICYTVFDIGPGCNCTAPFLGTISGVFPDCECCLPPPIPPDPHPYEPTIPEIDKHTYKVCESECDIEANKLFASAMYDIFKSKAYGVENCCPFNINLIWIRKELSDLSKIKC